MNDWLPEHHEARFVVEIVEQLGLKPIERACGTSGSGPTPALLLSVPVYGYATEVEKMRHLLLAMAGRALYAKRKSTMEPAFGIIKAILGFRQFSLLGLESVGGEFNLLAMAWNLKRVFVLAG